MATLKDGYDDGISWQKGKDRQDLVIAYLAKHAPLVMVEVVGNGADTVERVETYSDVPGYPDLRLRDRLTGEVLSYLEVTGTDNKPKELWLAVHKVLWAWDHPEVPWTAGQPLAAREEAPASGPVLDAQQIFQAVSRSVFVVVARDAHGKPFALGSAVAISPDSLVTNFHVVKQATTLSLAQNGQIHDCQVARFDELDDLCRLVAPGLKLAAVAVRPSESFATGEKVFAVGAPLGLELTLSEGIVSSLRGIPSAPIVQTTAAISPGSSGGGLFDDHGRLVGITTSQAGAGQNLNFALPTARLDDLNGNLNVRVVGPGTQSGHRPGATNGQTRHGRRHGGHRWHGAERADAQPQGDRDIDAMAP